MARSFQVPVALNQLKKQATWAGCAPPTLEIMVPCVQLWQRCRVGGGFDDTGARASWHVHWQRELIPGHRVTVGDVSRLEDDLRGLLGCVRESADVLAERLVHVVNGCRHCS